MLPSEMRHISSRLALLFGKNRSALAFCHLIHAIFADEGSLDLRDYQVVEIGRREPSAQSMANARGSVDRRDIRHGGPPVCTTVLVKLIECLLRELAKPALDGYLTPNHCVTGQN
jgi:hypothetical protein